MLNLQTFNQSAVQLSDAPFQLQFEKEKTALKYYLIGKEYHLALKALGFAERFTVGKRKDGVTPSLHHQIRVAMSIIQLKNVLDEELTIICALLHDIQEDYGVTSAELEKEFNKEVARVNWLTTKKFAGTHKNKEEFIIAISLDSVASLVKGEDRVDNLQKMIGVFSIEKIKDYSNEARTVFLPMLKKASKMFPEQQLAYYAIMQKLKKQLEFIDHYLKLSENYAKKIHSSINENFIKDQNLKEEIKNLKEEVVQLKLKTKVNQDSILEHFKISCRGLDSMKMDSQQRYNMKVTLAESLGITSLDTIEFNKTIVSGPIPS